MVKTYILAPNWTTSPPPDGPIKLGHLLDDLTEFVPINRDEVIDIPPDHLNKIDTKTGFKTSRSKLVSGELGFFARVMGLMAIGAGAGIYYKKDKDDVLSCESLDTMTFDPTTDYIADSMQLPETKRFMEGCKFTVPVYMVTGLKVGRGGSLKSSNSQGGGVTLDGGLSPPGSPVQVGSKGGFVQQKAEGESWEESTDFIVAFRVRKIWYDHGKLKDKTFKKNVVMQDGTSIPKGPDMHLREDDHILLTDVFTDVELTTDNDIENGEEVNWIIPNVHIE